MKKGEVVMNVNEYRFDEFLQTPWKLPFTPLRIHRDSRAYPYGIPVVISRRSFWRNVLGIR